MVQAATFRHDLSASHTISLTAKRHASIIEKENAVNTEHSLTFKDTRKGTDDLFESIPMALKPSKLSVEASMNNTTASVGVKWYRKITEKLSA
jgi:hypothetical protein